MRLLARFMAVLALLLAAPAFATVTSPTSFQVDGANGSTTAFAYNFLIPYQADGVSPAVTVVVYNSSTGVTTTLSGGQYSISGIGNPNGGAVTYPLTGGPLPAGSTVSIARNYNYTQNTAVGNVGFYPHTVEQVADSLEYQIQQNHNLIATGLWSFGSYATTPYSGTEYLDGSQNGGAVLFSLSSIANYANNSMTSGQVVAALGYTPLRPSNNLSDLTSAGTARGNLGLGSAAVQNIGTSGANVPLLNAANTWGGLQTLSGGLATPTITGLLTPLSQSQGGTGSTSIIGGLGYTPLNPANNLSEITNQGTARTNLGLGSAAVQSIGTSGATVPLLSTANSWLSTQTFPAATSAAGSLILQQGVTPTGTVTNGTMWQDGTAAYMEIGGAAVQLGSSASGTVSSFNSRQGAVVLQSGDVTGALGYTPLSTAAASFGGNAASASKLAAGRTINTAGDVACSAATFDGSANITLPNCNLPTVIAAGGAGGAGNWQQIPWFTFDAKGRISASGNTSVPYATNTVLGGVQLVNNAQAVDGGNFQEVETPGAIAASTGVGDNCGSGCSAEHIIYPGGIVLVMGKYDCGSAGCWAGNNTSVSDSAASICYAGVAIPYNPGGITSPKLGIQLVNIAGNAVTFSATGGNNSVQGFTFSLVCHN